MLKYDVVIGRTTNSLGTTVNVNALEITEYKSEELDFGVLTIPATTRFENFQILDRVDITVTDGSNTKVYDPFLVISDEVTPVSKQGFFKHTVTFIEDIHKFEKILSGNVFITQPLTGTKKTLLDVMNHIRDVVPFERASVHAATRLFNIDANLASFLDDIDAPQFFFTGMNLREMINAVASYVNAIGRMEENRNLVFSFYNEILGLFDIDESVIHKTLKNQTKYFTSSVESSIENATGADDEERALIIHPNPDGFISMRATNVKLTDETFEFRVPYPIERLVKVEYKPKLFLPRYFEVQNVADLNTLSSNPTWQDGLPGRQIENTFFKVTSTNTYYVYNATGATAVKNGVQIPNETFFQVFPVGLQVLGDGFGPVTYFEVLDVTTHIYEFNNYKRLNLDVADSFTRRLEDRQSNTMHYQINGTVISNNRLFGLFDGANVIENFYLRVTRANGYIFNIIPTFEDWDDQEYRITYVPYFGTRVRLNKDDVTDHPYNTQMSANQGERIVSAERLVRNIYGMAQRLGQDEIEFKRFYTDLSEQFELGQITADGFVIASKHLTYYLNYYMVTYQLSKNFNRFANRIALNQENRPFDISLGSKTTTRNLLYNEYVELDTERKDNTSLVRSLGVNVFMNTLRQSDVDILDKPIQYGIFAGADLADTQSSEGVLLHPIPFSEGNSLNFYWSFDDVIKAGDQLARGLYSKPDTFLGIPVGIKDVEVYNNRLIRYTNQDDELNTFELSFGSELPNIEPNNLPLVPIPQDGNSLIGGHSFRGVFNDNFIVNKDKSEILSMNYVLSVLPNFKYNNKIIVGRELTFSNNLIIANKNATLVVYTSTSQTYNSIENLYVKGSSTAYTITTTVDQESGKVVVSIPSNVMTTLKSWAIGDSDGNLYLGVNVDTDLTNTIYFNFKNKRENISYTFDDIDVIGLIAPRNLVLTPTETTIAATWEDDQLSDFYEVGIRAVLQGPGVVQPDYTTPPPTTNKFITFTGLTQGLTYQVRVRSSKDNVVSFYISSTASTSLEPAKVQGFTLSRIAGSNNSLLGSWNATANVTGYNAQARLASRSWETGPILNQTLGQNQTTTTFGVGVNNILVGRVRGINFSGPGDFSDEDINVIPLVTGRAATAISDTVIRATWDSLTNLFEPTINQEIGFDLRRVPIVELATGTTTSTVGVNVISDTTKSFTINAFVGDTLLITSGNSSGQSGTITSNTATTITVNTQLANSPSDLIGVTYEVIGRDEANAVTQRVLHTVPSFDFTGLSPETTHDIEIKAYYQYNDATYGKTVFSDTVTIRVETLEEATISEVSNPIITDRAGFPTSSALSWNIFNPNTVPVQVAKAFTFSGTTLYDTTIQPNETQVVTESNLAPGTTRTLYVKFRVGTSPNFVFSDTVAKSQTTVAPPPPPAPTGLLISNLTQNSARLTWNIVTEAVNGYEVLFDNFVYPTSASNSATSFDALGLTPNTSYGISVRSKGVGGSAPSAYSTTSFTTLSGPPSAPTFAEIQATGGPTYRMDWNTGAGATGYDYQISTSSNFSTIISSGNNIQSLSISAAYITGARIYGRVRSVNAAGVSAWKVADPTTGVVLG